MCQASVLRFCCGHGLLMGLTPCKLGPCPMIKTAGAKLPQQPFKCHHCQHKRTSNNASRATPSREATCAPSTGSLESAGSASSQITVLRRAVTAPLPGVVHQPTGTLQCSVTSSGRPRSSPRCFSFSCSSSNHYPSEFYLGLPAHLPHQDHACPPCQVERFRIQGDRDATVQAQKEFPHLKSEMLVRNGRIREDWESHLTLDKYVCEKRQEEKEMWLHVIRKWTQDLKKMRVLLAEEDGLGLIS